MRIPRIARETVTIRRVVDDVAGCVFTVTPSRARVRTVCVHTGLLYRTVTVAIAPTSNWREIHVDN